MGKIIAIEKKEVVTYKDDIIEYFKEVNSLSQKESYQNIIDDIKNYNYKKKDTYIDLTHIIEEINQQRNKDK